MTDKNIDWKKSGQVVKVGYISNVTCPYWNRGTVNLFVDENGNYFGCDVDPKFNPITGVQVSEIIESFCEE